MGDATFEFHCSGCKRSFSGTEHSIRGLILRGATCQYCRGTFVFPPQFASQQPALPGAAPQQSSSGGYTCPQCKADRKLVWVTCPYCGCNFDASPPPPAPERGPTASPLAPPPELKESAAHGVMGDIREAPPDPGIHDPSFLDEPAPKPKPTPAPAARPPANRDAAAADRLAEVDRIIKRSSGPEDMSEAWLEEVPGAAIQASLVSVVLALLFLHSLANRPLDGLAYGIVITGVFLVSGQLYRLMRSGQIPLFRGKGLFLRMLLGPILIIVAIGALLAPFHRWLKRTFPVIAKPAVPAGVGVVSVVVIALLQSMHDPLRQLRPLLDEALAEAGPPPEGFAFEEDALWVGKLHNATTQQLANVGLSDVMANWGMSGEDMSLDIERLDGERFDGRVSIPVAKTRLSVTGLYRDHVLVFYTDEVLTGAGHPAWPMYMAFSAAFDGDELRPIVGPRFVLEPPAEQAQE